MKLFSGCEDLDKHRLESIHLHNYFRSIMEGLDNDSLIIIPDYMSNTRLGRGPDWSQSMANGQAVPIFGVTFLYLEDGQLKRSYASMVCSHSSKTSYVTIRYLRKILLLKKFKDLISTRSKIFVTFISSEHI